MPEYMEERLGLKLRNVLPIIQQGIIEHTTYFGIRAFKSPMDAWVYQEILFENRPDLIIEIGTANGGSTLFLAHLCDLLSHGRVVGLDLSHQHVPDTVLSHPRITLLEGDACDLAARVRALTSNHESALIIEDSSHTYENTLNVLRCYAPFVKPGGYLIVEDTIGQHGLPSGRKPGPYEATRTFVEENRDFQIDRSREHFFLTWNPTGYIKRVSSNTRKTGEQRPTPSFSGFNLRRIRLREAVRLLVPPVFVLLLEKLNNRRMISSQRRSI